jgi:hypothetical protein
MTWTGMDHNLQAIHIERSTDMEYIEALIICAASLYTGWVLGVWNESRRNNRELDKAYLTGHVDGYEKAQHDSMIVPKGESA